MVPEIGISNYRISAFRVFDLGNKVIFHCSLYIKASEFQCISVYYWRSLGKDLIYTLQ